MTASASYALVSAPSLVIQGRPWTYATALKDASGAAIDMTGATIAGVINWYGGQLVPAVSAPNAQGTFGVSMSAGQTAGLPEGLYSILDITVTDTAGNTSDYDVVLDVRAP
jgi:hypothetical protein